MKKIFKILGIVFLWILLMSGWGNILTMFFPQEETSETMRYFYIALSILGAVFFAILARYLYIQPENNVYICESCGKKIFKPIVDEKKLLELIRGYFYAYRDKLEIKEQDSSFQELQYSLENGIWNLLNNSGVEIKKQK